MQPNLRIFLTISVLSFIICLSGLLYYLVYLNSSNQIFSIAIGAGVLLFGGYTVIFLFGTVEKFQRKKNPCELPFIDPGILSSEADENPVTLPDEEPLENSIPVPAILMDRKAKILLEGLTVAGLLDENFKPSPNMQLCQKAYIAHSLCEILNVGQKWETFEKFWDCSGLRQSYNNSCKVSTIQPWRIGIYQTLIQSAEPHRFIADTRNFIRWKKFDCPDSSSE